MTRLSLDSKNKQHGIANSSGPNSRQALPLLQLKKNDLENADMARSKPNLGADPAHHAKPRRLADVPHLSLGGLA